MAHVFFYGTLMRGHANHAVLERVGARFVAVAATHEPRTLVDLGPYPALLPADPERDAAPVHGEVFLVDDAALAILDEFEGVPDLYRREPIALDGATTPEPWTYVFAGAVPASAVVVAGGRYTARGQVLRSGARDALPR